MSPERCSAVPLADGHYWRHFDQRYGMVVIKIQVVQIQQYWAQLPFFNTQESEKLIEMDFMTSQNNIFEMDFKTSQTNHRLKLWTSEWTWINILRPTMLM